MPSPFRTSHGTRSSTPSAPVARPWRGGILRTWPIKQKLLLALGILLVMVATLATSGIVGTYCYRGLAASLRARSTELPLATAMAQHVSDLRVTHSEARPLPTFAASEMEQPLDARILRGQFDLQLQSFQQTLASYRHQLKANQEVGNSIGDAHHERRLVEKIEKALERVLNVHRDRHWMLDDEKAVRVGRDLEELQTLTAELPSYLHARMNGVVDDVRNQYRTLIVLTVSTSVLVTGMLLVLVWMIYTWIFRPVRILVAGSRCVAEGEFDHRTHLPCDDEMSELAEAMNDMTERFQTIRDDLDRQVQERTRQVVRSEQLASVGFLAAGVAHEINNPLASIAMCAESLESRLEEILADPHESPTNKEASEQRQQLVEHYLQMIQEEAFRCKEITEKLLDFSRMDKVERQDTELLQLVHGVVDMVSHLGKYQEKNIVFDDCVPVMASINPQEIKQVVLNLLTNALDSLDPQGTVRIGLHVHGDQVELVFSDDGCGMTDEVKEHLFEPFFTRRRSGQGTGLGLSIAYRIVEDHGGGIEAESAGPGKGSQVIVTLPSSASNKEAENRYQAA